MSFGVVVQHDEFEPHVDVTSLPHPGHCHGNPRGPSGHAPAVVVDTEALVSTIAQRVATRPQRMVKAEGACLRISRSVMKRQAGGGVTVAAHELSLWTAAHSTRLPQRDVVTIYKYDVRSHSDSLIHNID
jgi:hypothetical protein